MSWIRTRNVGAVGAPGVDWSLRCFVRAACPRPFAFGIPHPTLSRVESRRPESYATWFPSPLSFRESLGRWIRSQICRRLVTTSLGLKTDLISPSRIADPAAVPTSVDATNPPTEPGVAQPEG